MDIREFLENMLGYQAEARFRKCKEERRQSKALNLAQKKSIRKLVGEIKLLENIQHESGRKFKAALNTIVDMTSAIETQDRIIAQMKAKGIPIIHPMEEYFNNKYPKTIIEYAGRPLPLKGAKANVRIDVRNFCKFEKDAAVVSATDKATVRNRPDDVKALDVLKWVRRNFRYKFDHFQTPYSEFWFFPFESLFIKAGDCEDGAILIKNMLNAAGIANWKSRLTAGDVVYNGSVVGHGYVTYYCEEKDKWVLLDWCYAPNEKPINERPDYKKESLYRNVWFSCDSKHAWSKGTRLGTSFKRVKDVKKRR